MPQMFKLASSIAGLRVVALALFALSAGACASDTLEPSTTMGSDAVEGLASDSLPADSLVVQTLGIDNPAFALSAVALARQGTPFGFWRLEYSQLSVNWTSLHRGASPAGIRRDLEIARKVGGRVFLQLAGRKQNYQNSNGSFSLTKFKALLAQYKGLNLDSYIADGTLAGHMLIDEPSDKSNWNGKPMPYSDVEAAAKASKAIWPKMPALVRAVPTWLQGANFRWVYLDGAWGQYSARKGDVTRYVAAETRAAGAEGLKMVWGLNVLDGGDGSSGRRGTVSGRYNMSATELQKYGKVLLGASNTCGFLMWMYSSTYMSRSTVMDAMKSLSRLAKTRPIQACR